jgi:hypothetical protein
MKLNHFKPNCKDRGVKKQLILTKMPWALSNCPVTKPWVGASSAYPGLQDSAIPRQITSKWPKLFEFFPQATFSPSFLSYISRMDKYQLLMLLDYHSGFGTIFKK